MKNYYRITNGIATIIDCGKIDEEWCKSTGSSVEYDPCQTCIAYAQNEEGALELAGMYDQDEVEADNIWCQACGRAHAALSFGPDLSGNCPQPKFILCLAETPFAFLTQKQEKEFITFLEQKCNISITVAEKKIFYCDRGNKFKTLKEQGIPCNVIKEYQEWLKKFILWSWDEWIEAWTTSTRVYLNLTGPKAEWLNNPEYGFETIFYALINRDYECIGIAKKIITDPKTFKEKKSGFNQRF